MEIFISLSPVSIPSKCLGSTSHGGIPPPPQPLRLPVFHPHATVRDGAADRSLLVGPVEEDVPPERHLDPTQGVAGSRRRRLFPLGPGGVRGRKPPRIPGDIGKEPLPNGGSVTSGTDGDAVGAEKLRPFIKVETPFGDVD